MDTFTLGTMANALVEMAAALRKLANPMFVVRSPEEIRIERWHATYNAALTGLLARMPSPSPGAMEPALSVVLGNAEWITDRKHGPLKETPR